MDSAILSLSFLPATLDRSHAKLPTKAVFILSLLRARWCCQSKHTSELFFLAALSPRPEQVSETGTSPSVPKAKYRFRFIVARRVGDDRWERHGDERGVDDEYDGGQEDDYMYEDQREGSGEAGETARVGADDATEGRRAVEGGGPGDATEGGEGGRRRRGKRKVGDG